MSDLDWMFESDTPADSSDDLAWMFGDSEPGGNMEIETARQLDSPKVYARREEKRKLVSGLKKESLSRLLPALPEPGETVWIIGNGAGAEHKHAPGGVSDSPDFGTFIPVLLEYLGNKDCVAYISTWTLNLGHAQAMLECLDDGRLKSLTVCTDPYFKRRTPGVANFLIAGLIDRGQTFLCWKNHVKAVCIEAPDGRTVTVTGSANLNAQPRCEAYVLTTAPDVYRFFRDDFFHAMTQAQEQ